MRRVILFTRRLAEMRAFYCDIIGLEVVVVDSGWIDLRAGDCNIALHAAGTAPGVTGGDAPHKIVFFAADVAAARADLVSRGATLGPVKTFDDLHLCDGADPDGNRIQFSNRV